MHKDRHDGAATVLSGAGNGDQETLRMSRNVHGVACEGGPYPPAKIAIDAL